MITLSNRPVAAAPPAIPGARRGWKPLYWIMAILTLLTLQLCCGTYPPFAALVALFCLLTYGAVMAAGGLMSLTGAMVFFLAVQNVLVAQVAKVVFWQPADSHLSQPLTTMGVYNAGMLGFYVAAVLFKRSRLSRRPPLFAPETDPTRLMWVAYISTAFFIFQAVFTRAASVDAETGAQNTGGLFGLLQAIPFLFALSVASGTAYLVVSSRGRRSLGFVNLAPIAVILVLGTFSASREVYPDAIGIYFLTCYAFRFRFRPIHFGVLLAGAYVAQFIFFPYALYARSFVRTPDVQKNIQMAAGTLLEVISDPAKFQKLEYGTSKYTSHNFLYYGKPYPTLDRFSQITYADAVIDVATRQSNSEMDTITPGFLAIPPRFLLTDKPTGSPNTVIAHRVPKMLNKKDRGTGISMGFFCDSFASFSWPGAFCIPLLIMFGLLWAYSVIISLRLWQNIYALSFILSMPHIFSEAVISNQVGIVLQTPVVFVVVMYLILFLVSFAMRAQVRIQEAKQRATRLGRARLVGRRLSLPQGGPVGGSDEHGMNAAQASGPAK